MRKVPNSGLLKGPGKRGHIVAGTLLPMMFLGLRKLGNICCGHKMFLNKIRNIFVSRTRNLCCARGQTAKHLCRQQCVRNNVSSFVRALKRPSHGKLKLANSCWQTQVGCVKGIKTVGKHVGKLLATNRTCLYSRQLFHQLFRVGKLVFDM